MGLLSWFRTRRPRRQSYVTSVIVARERGLDKEIEADSVQEAVDKTYQMYLNDEVNAEDDCSHLYHVVIAVRDPFSGEWSKHVME